MSTPYTVADFDADLDHPYAWPGGYPRYFVTNDGEALSFAAAKDNASQIRDAIESHDNGGWRVVEDGLEFN